MLVLLDEGPAIPDDIAQVHRDNCAGGGTFVTACNPSSRNDWVFAAHNEALFHTITASCLDQPNVKLRRIVQPGLVGFDWVNERLTSWGPKDPRWFTEVLGEWPDNDMTRLISELEFSDACVRGESMTLESQINGPLCIGMNPASGGDKSVLAIVRGSKVAEYVAFHGGNNRIMTELDGSIHKYQRWPHEQVWVRYDASAQWGAHLGREIQQYREAGRDWLSVEGLDARGDHLKSAVLIQNQLARLRDAYWINLAGRIKADLGLLWNQELHDECMLVEAQPDRENGTRVTEQPVFRKRLGHSPDVTNALMYAVWTGTVTPLYKSSPVVPVTIQNPEISATDQQRIDQKEYWRRRLLAP